MKEEERLAVLEAERKIAERKALIAAKLAPIQALHGTQPEEFLSLVRPLVEFSTEKILENIKTGDCEVVSDPPEEVKLEYTKPLQQYRIKKLKNALTIQRNNLLKKDFD